VQCGPIRLGSDLIKLDEKGIQIIKNQNQPDEIKIINLVKSIRKIAEQKANDPVLISVKERAEDIMKRYETRQITTQEALKHLLELSEKEAKRQEQQVKEGISSVAWFLRDILAHENIIDVQAVYDIEAIIATYPEFAKSDKLIRDLKNDIYDRLDQLGLSLEDQKRIADKIIETLGKMSV
jgi:type I restriction enzyme R subunit